MPITFACSVLRYARAVSVSDAFTSGTGISAAVRSYAHLENPQTQLIFLTSSKDNRFDSYQVLRPLLNKAIQ